MYCLPFDFLMNGRKALHILTIPYKFTSAILQNIAMVHNSTSPNMFKPALFNKAHNPTENICRSCNPIFIFYRVLVSIGHKCPQSYSILHIYERDSYTYGELRKDQTRSVKWSISSWRNYFVLYLFIAIPLGFSNQLALPKD